MTEIVEPDVLETGCLQRGVEAAAQGAVLNVHAGRVDENESSSPVQSLRRLS
jgi:hypothetical protein